jgi:hypothetical protein
MSALTKMSFKLLGFLKAKTGGSLKILHSSTDKHQYLSPQSCHPNHCTKSIPYSQALRIKRICSNEQTNKKTAWDGQRND